MEIDEQETGSSDYGKRRRTIGDIPFERIEPRSKRDKGKESDDTPHILPIPPEQLYKTEPDHPMFYKRAKVDEEKLSEGQKRKLEAGRELRADQTSAKDILEKIHGENMERYMQIVAEAQRLWEEDVRREAEEAAKGIMKDE